jgi:hypothetical protein
MDAARAAVNGRTAAAVVAVLVWSHAAAAAEVCPRGNDPAAGPLLGGNGPADFGAVPEACGATDALLRLRTALLVASAMPDYYGSVIGGATLRGRYQLGERTLLSAAADVFSYRYVDNANLVSRGASMGPATVGLQQTFLVGAGTATSLNVRVLLPLDSARQNGVETGLELGGGLRTRAGSRVVLDGGLALAAPLDIVGGQSHLRLEPAALAEAWLRLRPWVAVCAGVDIRVAALPSFDLIAFVPRVGPRFALRRRFWTAALVELPVAGSDRTDLIGGLYLGFVPD